MFTYRTIAVAGLVCVYGICFSGQVMAAGLDLPRVPNTELLLPGPPPDAPGSFRLERLFPRIEIKNITDIIMAPGEDHRVFVVSQKGRVFIVPNDPDPAPEDVTLALDISHRTCHFLEQGMYNLEFDPDWQTNRRVYLHYSPNTVCSNMVPSPPQRISRFHFHPGQLDVIDPDSEEILIEQIEHGTFHYGGAMAFGPDGMFYIALGDGSSHPWQAQNPATILGAILRIDVVGPPDEGLLYAIPQDNPFFGRPGWRQEIYAFGFRNPFAFNFDPITGMLIACDVGQASFEEVNLINPGGNYGWPDKEGFECGPGVAPGTCDNPNFTDPALVLPHDGGQMAIIGGSTIDTTRLPELARHYIYASIFSGQVYAAPVTPEGLGEGQLISENPNLTLTAIARMPDGDLWFGDYADSDPGGFYKTTGGGIYRLARSESGGDFPLRLSDHPALMAAGRGEGHLVDGVFEYRPSAQLWSDGSAKERYVALPGSTQMEWTERDAFGFPEGSIVVKNFALPRDDRFPTENLQRIETRVMLLHESTWHGFTYEWDEDESDAYLLANGKRRSFDRIGLDGQPYRYEWAYPSRSECIQCHTPASGFVLGVTSNFLNHDFVYTSTGRRANQLKTWQSIGLFSNELPAEHPELEAIPDYRDASLEPGLRMKSYLVANCAMCHRPGGGVQSTVDLRWETPIHAMGLIGVDPLRGDLGIAHPRVVAGNDLDRSVLYQRMTSLNPNLRMPPIGTSIVDPMGEEILRKWIKSLPGANAWILGGE